MFNAGRYMFDDKGEKNAAVDAVNTMNFFRLRLKIE